MITIQISSDPYKRKITYDRVDSDQLVAIDSSNPDTPEKLKLLSVDYSSCFFPFKAYEIANLIWHTYSTNSTPVCIRFRGTTEEFRELCAVCDILNKENSEQPPESQLPPLTYEQANEYLANAGDILPEVTGYFKSIKDIIAHNITASDSKKLIDQQQEKFDDVSKKEIPVCVIGNYSSGKSTFINAILGCEVLPSGDKPLTAKIYEIRCSDNSEVADVEFISNHMVVTISFNRGGYAIRPESYSDELSGRIRECLEKEKENALAQRVQSLLQVINDGAIDDRVKIHIPFNSDSPLRNSEHPYVLFDTPGDNVANHEHHIQVLQEALRGMSNGLMLYVTVSNQLHTMSNQQLCDKVKAIQEIDTRFTMVIVNQADNADFSEYNRTEIIESPIPVTLQPEGIYYVSSVMALGSKIDGDFVKDNNAMIYMQKQAFFMKKKGERFAQLLFLYNIAPKQIEIASEEGALHYSEYGDKERVLANSGLWAIEQEIQRFADNYAPYNKCYQSLLFLLKVREIAENDIADAVRMHDKSRAEYQSQLEAGIKKLLAELTISRDEFVEKAFNGYPTEMEASKKEAYTPIAKAELVKLESELTSALEAAVGYSERAEIADKAKEKTFKIQNIFNADVRADIATSYKYWREKSTERDNAREEIDTTAADQLLDQVKEKFNLSFNRAQTVLFQSSSNYWKTRAEELRKKLLIRDQYFGDMAEHNPGHNSERLTRGLLASSSIEIFSAYLPQLQELYTPVDKSTALRIVKSDGEELIEQFPEFDKEHNIRFINISKWVTDKRENSLEKLVNVYAVLSNEQCNIALIFHRTKTETQVYLAVVNTKNAGDNSDADEYIKRLTDAVRGNFPGSVFSSKAAMGSPKFLAEMDKKSVAIASNIPTEKSEKFISQTIEKLLDGVIPESVKEEYTLILLATPIRDVETRKLRLSELYTGLAPYSEWQTNFTYTETMAEGSSATLGVNVGASAGIQNGQNQSIQNSIAQQNSEANQVGRQEGKQQSQANAQSQNNTTGQNISDGTSSASTYTTTEGEVYNATHTDSSSITDTIGGSLSANYSQSVSATAGVPGIASVGTQSTFGVGASVDQHHAKGTSIADAISQGTNSSVSNATMNGVNHTLTQIASQTIGKTVTDTIGSSTSTSIAQTLGRAVTNTLGKTAGVFSSFNLGGNVGASFARSSNVTATIGKGEGITQS